MGIPHTGLRTQRTRLLIAVAVSMLGCNPFKQFTYDPDLQNVALPPGVNSDPDQFRGQVAARGGAGPSHFHRRLGKCNPACLVDITIAPVGDTREVNPTGYAHPAAPGSGRPVAKILNLDPTSTEDTYGFRPSSQFEYYVWADTTGSGARARMTLLEVPAGHVGSVRAIYQKSLLICVHDLHYPPFSDADFRWCEGLIASTGSSVSQAALVPLAPLAALLTRVSEFIVGSALPPQPPIWLRCTDGCCG